MQNNLFVGGSICSIAERTWKSPPFFGGGVYCQQAWSGPVWPFSFLKEDETTMLFILTDDCPLVKHGKKPPMIDLFKH